VRFGWGEPEVLGQCTSVHECSFGKLGFTYVLSSMFSLCVLGEFLPAHDLGTVIRFPYKAFVYLPQF
jgi:hypothetical protein